MQTLLLARGHHGHDLVVVGEHLIGHERGFQRHILRTIEFELDRSGEGRRVVHAADAFDLLVLFAATALIHIDHGQFRRRGIEQCELLFELLRSEILVGRGGRRRRMVESVFVGCRREFVDGYRTWARTLTKNGWHDWWWRM